MRIPLILNGVEYVSAMVDSGCECFGVISEALTSRLGLETLRVPTRRLDRAGVIVGKPIERIAFFKYDIDGYKAQGAAYVVPDWNKTLYLGRPWLDKEGVLVDAAKGQIVIRRAGGLVVPEEARRQYGAPMLELKGHTAIAALQTLGNVEAERDHVYLTSLAALDTILQDTLPINIARKESQRLPQELSRFQGLFSPEDAKDLPPHRGSLDHTIRLQRANDGSKKPLPWGALYNMPRDQLLELRRQLTVLLDKGWIRASSSSAGAPVLLVKKASGAWRFCVDYRALNKITETDRYPLPLIKETLRTLSGVQWFTKVDVRAAFHRLRMAAGDEPLTAFRTRFGLYEWLVCPMGLAGAPASFQRYINQALGPTLGDFATAYLDDVLIYSKGSRADHLGKVAEVLQKLQDAGLFLDPQKCAFAVKTVEYLGYVLEAGKSIRPNPEKLRAIREWEAPTTVKGVRSFLGFANFYRDFIPDFSELSAPLHRLTKKDAPFVWGPGEEQAFQQLKRTFIQSPVLEQWDPTRDTVVEADCSGFALGGCLSQRVDGILKPVAYHSAALSPAQRNYTIHDKELTAVVKCLQAWRAELQGLENPFTILTDHKNLEYFTSKRDLSERQHRCAEFLATFRYRLEYRPGRLAGRPDALSRRDQDGAHHIADQARLMIPVELAAIRTSGNAGTTPGCVRVFVDSYLQQLWEEALTQDTRYDYRLKAVERGDRTFGEEADTNSTLR